MNFVRHISLVTLLFVVSPSYSQILLSSYANFSVEDKQIFWIKVYDRPGLRADSIASIISEKMKLDNTMFLLEKRDDEIIWSMKDRTFEKNGDKLSAKLIVELKASKYRITLTTITRTMGIKTMRRAQAFGVASEVKDYNGVGFEDDFLNKSRTSINSGQPNMKGLDFWNSLFLKEFDFQSSTGIRKRDW